MALGANRMAVVRSVVGEGVGLAAAGVALGLLLAWIGTRLLDSLLFGVTATDPTTFIAVPALVLAVAAAASLAPAMRASRADPMTALRAE